MIVTILTCFTEPREAPSDVKAYSISSSEIRVTWKPPNPGPGRPRGYEVLKNCLCVLVCLCVHTLHLHTVSSILHKHAYLCVEV